MNAKTCSRCRQMKPLSEYYRNGKRLRTECKTCNGAMNAPRYQTQRYKDRKWCAYYDDYDKRLEHIERSRKNRIERKYPYLRTEEHKQKIAEKHAHIHSSPMTFFNIKALSKEQKRQIGKMVKEMGK